MVALLRIATRQSQLALWQANFVKTQLQNNYPQLQIELLPQLTQGDKIRDKKLAEFGGKGVFVKDLEIALLEERADIVVHSMKDVPPEISPDFIFPAFFARDDARDVLCSNHFTSLADLPLGATVGTCSVRREAQLRALRPDLQIKFLRGNVDTRLQKLDAGDYDAILLAAAGVHRLGQQRRISQYFTLEQMLPSVGQGVIGVECLHGNTEVIELLKPLNDRATALCLTAESAFVKRLHGNCHSPIGVNAMLQGNEIILRGLVARIDGKTLLTASNRGADSNAMEVGFALADALLQQGAGELLLTYT